MYDIEWINTTKPTVDYSMDEMDMDEATLYFEEDWADELRGCDSDDIGGLIVYVNAGEVRAVYDYENFCGWVAKNG